VNLSRRAAFVAKLNQLHSRIGELAGECNRFWRQAWIENGVEG